MIMDALQLSKNVIRKEIKKKLTLMSDDFKKQQSGIVVQKLFSLKQFEGCQRISVYLSTKDEVDTVPVLLKIFESSKICYVPRYNKNLMEMVRLRSMEDYNNLPITKWNIKQPELNEQRENAMDTEGLDLVIVPGVAFTTCGKRIGHGKGYYDIFLNALNKNQKNPVKTVALAFKEQILDDIPCNEDDFKIDTILYPDS